MRKLIVLFSFLIYLSENVFSQFINEFFVNGIKKEILVVPIDYQLDQSIRLIGIANSGDPTFVKVADYKTQLDKVCAKADALGGNIVMITNFNNQKLREAYKLKAKVFKCSNYNNTKDSMINTKFPSNNSGIVLYRPNYTHSLNDLFDFTVIVENQEYLIKRNTKQFIPINNEQLVEIMIKGSDDKIKIDFKPGQTYYIRCLAYFPNYGLSPMPNTIMIPLGGYIPKIDLMNLNGQGEIESKIINTR